MRLVQQQPLRVRHTVTVTDRPLACFSNLPGYGAELFPEQVRALAAALLRVADDCEALHAQTRRGGPELRQYQLLTTD